jgi:hypothetical protein
MTSFKQMHSYQINQNSDNKYDHDKATSETVPINGLQIFCVKLTKTQSHDHVQCV